MHFRIGDYATPQAAGAHPIQTLIFILNHCVHCETK